MQPQEWLLPHVQVVDGTGAAPFPADVLVRDGRIEAVEAPGSIPTEPYQLEDTTGLVVAPGFIDVHSHADNAPLLPGTDVDTSKLLQGVTTEVVGNCGFSLGPTTPRHADDLREYLARLFPRGTSAWASLEALFYDTDDRGYVTNYAPLIGHNTLRIAAMGMADRSPDADELRMMQELVIEGVRAGVFGLSSGLIYPPGLFSTGGELAALVRTIPASLVYATHVRGEGQQVLASIAEALAVGERTGRPVHISHLKASGRSSWGLMREILDRLDAARAAGVDVRQDVYPYTAGSTMLTALLPPWLQVGGRPAMLRGLNDPATCRRLFEELEHDGPDWENFAARVGWDGVVVASSPSHAYDGLTLVEAGERLGISPAEALVEILLQEDLEGTMIVHAMTEPDLIDALRSPHTMIGSDGLPPGSGGRPHPRQYGTFPRVLARYVRERGILDLGEAVRRMTSLPAASFGLRDRGTIAPGRVADLVAFDPGTVCDLATYSDPEQPPAGISWVMQQGLFVVRDGKFSGDKLGRRLRPHAS